MEQEYTISIGYKIFFGLLAVALAGATVFVFFNEITAPNHNYGYILFPLFGLSGAALIIANLIKRKIIVSDYKIISTAVWGTKEIINEDIKGFKIGEGKSTESIYIFLKDESQDRIDIGSRSNIGDSKELIAWLNDRFPDLDKAEYEQEKQEILQDPTYGSTQEDREQAFNNAKKYAKIYSGASGIFIVALLIFHIDAQVLIVATLIYPIIGILLIAYSKGLVRLYSNKSSAYLSVFGGAILPSIALVIQTMSNVNLLNFESLVIPVLVTIAMFFMVIYFVLTKNVKDDLLYELMMGLVIAIVYAFGSVLQINCGFDTSQPQTFRVKIVDRYVKSDKNTSYHLILNKWGNDQQEENISVPKLFYKEEPIGAEVNLYLQQGTLNIPWFYVTQ